MQDQDHVSGIPAKQVVGAAGEPARSTLPALTSPEKGAQQRWKVGRHRITVLVELAQQLIDPIRLPQLESAIAASATGSPSTHIGSNSSSLQRLLIINCPSTSACIKPQPVTKILWAQGDHSGGNIGTRK